MDPFVLGEDSGPEISGLDDGAARLGEVLNASVHEASSAVPLPGEDEFPVGADDHLWMYDSSGRVWDLGPADVDTDADGVDDSLARTGPDGLTVYTDRDHDGRVDSVTCIGADGSYAAHHLDAQSGVWMPTDSGRLD